MSGQNPEAWLAARLAAGRDAETWAPVPEWWYEENGMPVPPVPHEFSDQGRARSANGVLADQPMNRPKDAPRELRYRKVNLSSGGQRKTVSVHSMVLICHGDPDHPPGPRPEGMHTSHENDVCSHNWTENLRWRRPDGPDGNEQRKPLEVRRAASAAGRAAQVAMGITSPPPSFPCRNHARCGGMVRTEGRRCLGCVKVIGQGAADLLRCGMRLQDVAEHFGYTGPRWAYEIAVRHGGYEGTEAAARMQRPSPWQRVRLVALKRRTRGY